MSWRFIIAVSLGLSVFGSTSLARADLAPAFVGRLSVDTQYVQGAAGATDVAFSADGRAVITRKTGQVVIRRSDGTLTTLAYPFGGTLDTSSEKGLLGVVADPNVAANSAFYFYVSNGPTADKHRVYRAVLTASNTLLVDASPIVGLSRGVGPGLEGPANHDGGGMVIHDGHLYIGVGDTGSNASPPVNKYGSCLNKGNGKILRVALDGSVPADNPLVGVPVVSACATPTGSWTTGAPDTRIVAWGFRNPWRLWVDPLTALLWVGDVGESTREEISVGQGDEHHGYPFVEGDRIWGDVEGRNCSSLVPSRPCTPPAYAYPRAIGQAVTGGLIPEGCGWSGVFPTPHYVFGDSSADWIAALQVNASRTGVTAATPVDVADYGGSPVSFRMGPDASLYVVYLNLGAVYRISPTERTGSDCVASVPSSSRSSTGWLVLMLGLAGFWVLGATRMTGDLRQRHGFRGGGEWKAGTRSGP